MTLLIVTHVLHKKQAGQWFAYGPYVREMNLWGNHADQLLILAPATDAEPNAIDLPYQHSSIRFVQIPKLDFSHFTSKIRSTALLPLVMWRLFQTMRQADHVHVRCPGNIGLLGCIVQILFPGKRKTAKYAGNWDWNSVQPWSYRLQQILLRHTRLTQNMTALVYGHWPDQTRNLRSFFTASYRDADRIAIAPRMLSADQTIRLVFAGTLTPNKRPEIALETARLLINRGYSIQLDLFGAGVLQTELSNWIAQHDLQNHIHLHGNVPAERLATAYQQAHFLVFASRSEGWPKAVAEAMFWACLPLTTAVSCVPQMLGDGRRGDLLPPNPEAIADQIEYYLRQPAEYRQKAHEAQEWSRQYTLEKLESEIRTLLL